MRPGVLYGACLDILCPSFFCSDLEVCVNYFLQDFRLDGVGDEPHLVLLVYDFLWLKVFVVVEVDRLKADQHWKFRNVAEPQIELIDVFDEAETISLDFWVRLQFYSLYVNEYQIVNFAALRINRLQACQHGFQRIHNPTPKFIGLVQVSPQEFAKF